uniref:Peroxin-19 n=1 Tax=Phaeomonas parva TaxID=124430 RepID=A0A7S1XKR9_9STRA|mmetsp:Transcript_11856/g.35964  ORF Transcript_11856/g.35964 Transcript_11856/m.35964 type:complete len:305 (+) Transcript_11856:30-944(+)|eukprot:CAMPEP_0118884140 /NCGR_PEP_ID=MMETSP1163-20130328/23059_1 /TAXON_ID=124430 /ORGANISM="Phaeomonas parva, Strain CCMP2877" /LENGTH=304 /DNA_ID=CAMNT_0006821821 /DNA_START=325 /DNA_END=1239 /DNA_ORIENTATION=+
MSNLADYELDAILDSALNELEEEELTAANADADTRRSAAPGVSADAGRIDKVMEAESRAQAAATAESLMNAINAEDGMAGAVGGANVLQETLQVLSSNAEGTAEFEDFMASMRANNELGEGGDVDRSIARTLEAISSQGAQMDGLETAKVEEMGENIMEQMMAEFQRMGEKEDMDEVMDGMMRQLLGKDIMYEPMKAVCEKFPEWLADKREHLSEDDYQRYGKMYQGFQRLVATYETEPDNFPRLMELMQDVQEFGQPPAEIIKELAPGLEFNEDGMPIMPNVGPNVMPFIPGAMPDQQPCSVM